MKALVSCADAARLDESVRSSLCVPGLLLMEKAASSMVDALKRHAHGKLIVRDGNKPLIVAVCGGGNNGGDALAMLRQLAFEDQVRGAAILVSENLSELSGLHAATLKRMGIPLLSFQDESTAACALIGEAAVLVDGISGLGARGSLRSEILPLLETMHASSALIVAIDLPSGLSDGKPGALVEADYTFCVEPRKVCLYRPAYRGNAGCIIGIEGVFPRGECGESVFKPEPAAFLLEDRDLDGFVYAVPDHAYKSMRGIVGIYAGATGTSGAAVLCARASQALVGMVSMIVDPDIWQVCASSCEQIMVSSDLAAPSMKKAQAISVGSGWGQSPSRDAVFSELWNSELPLTVDADGLAILKRLDLPARGAPTVLTPHPGELAALSDTRVDEILDNPEPAARAVARRYHAVVIAKSHVSWIVPPDGPFAVYDGMNPCLAIAGSGDVLAGLCAAFMASSSALNRDVGTVAFDAARAAVLAHGGAGNFLRAQKGSFSAMDLAVEAGHQAWLARERTSAPRRA